MNDFITTDTLDARLRRLRRPSRFRLWRPFWRQRQRSQPFRLSAVLPSYRGLRQQQPPPITNRLRKRQSPSRRLQLALRSESKIAIKRHIRAVNGSQLFKWKIRWGFFTSEELRRRCPNCPFRWRVPISPTTDAATRSFDSLPTAYVTRCCDEGPAPTLFHWVTVSPTNLTVNLFSTWTFVELVNLFGRS